MLTCLACSKRLGEALEPDSASEDPRTKETGESLIWQIKRFVLKLSASNRPCKKDEGMSCSGVQGVGELLFSKNLQHRQQDAASFDALSNDDAGDSDEWSALVEPGVLITFTSLPGGLNHLKRIRFSRAMFDKRKAQKWWGENYDRVTELYNVQSLHTPPRLESEPRTTRSSTSSDDAAEWVLQDDPGVIVTVRQLQDRPRKLRRVKFSRQYFSEASAKQWWEDNWERIQAQYL